jgi:hypothetical protein
MEPIEILKFIKSGFIVEKKVFTEAHKQAMLSYYTNKGFTLLTEESSKENGEITNEN